LYFYLPELQRIVPLSNSICNNKLFQNPILRFTLHSLAAPAFPDARHPALLPFVLTAISRFPFHRHWLPDSFLIACSVLVPP
jgi:hypothetical protein